MVAGMVVGSTAGPSLVTSWSLLTSGVTEVTAMMLLAIFSAFAVEMVAVLSWID